MNPHMSAYMDPTTFPEKFHSMQYRIRTHIQTVMFLQLKIFRRVLLVVIVIVYSPDFPITGKRTRMLVKSLLF